MVFQWLVKQVLFHHVWRRAHELITDIYWEVIQLCGSLSASLSTDSSLPSSFYSSFCIWRLFDTGGGLQMLLSQLSVFGLALFFICSSMVVVYAQINLQNLSFIHHTTAEET